MEIQLHSESQDSEHKNNSAFPERNFKRGKLKYSEKIHLNDGRFRFVLILISFYVKKREISAQSTNCSLADFALGKVNWMFYWSKNHKRARRVFAFSIRVFRREENVLIIHEKNSKICAVIVRAWKIFYLYNDLFPISSTFYF